jgi:3-hydroxyisobutyrate dehydrogenase-like beta-hydroxyacid dehydrogenase
LDAQIGFGDLPQRYGKHCSPTSCSFVSLTVSQSIVTSAARELAFPLPLSSVAEQQYISAASQGYEREDDSGLVRLYIPNSPSAVHDRASKMVSNIPSPSVTIESTSKVGFIGLGAMGNGMALSLVKAGFHVSGYDVYPPSIEKFASEAGKSVTAATSPSEAASDAEVLILMVQNASQAEDALFGSGKAAEALPKGAVVILSSTVPPSSARSIRQRLTELGNNIDLVDAPVSGGVVRAAQGQLTVCRLFMFPRKSR